MTFAIPPTCLTCLHLEIWVVLPLDSSKVFSDTSPKILPPSTQAINNDRSLVKWRSCLGQGHIFLDFHCLQVLDPEKANFVWKHASKPLCKQLIDCAKPDDVHLPFQQFLLITILIYTETFQPKLKLSKGQFFNPFFNKASTRNVLLGVRSTWSSAMLVLFNLFAERAIMPHFYATPGFFWNRGICNKRKTKIDSLLLTFEIYRVMRHFCIITVNHRDDAISALRILMTDFLLTLKVGFGRVTVQNFFGKSFAFLCFNSVLDGRLLDCVTRLWTLAWLRDAFMNSANGNLLKFALQNRDRAPEGNSYPERYYSWGIKCSNLYRPLQISAPIRILAK